MNRPLSSLILTTALLCATGCATSGAVPVDTAQALRGEIVLSEPAPGISSTGTNAAVAIGSAVVGVLVPGPWGGVAGVASGQAGKAATSGTGNTVRYHVRMADGTIQAFDQGQSVALPAGTPVDILTMSDGSKRVVEAKPPINKNNG